MTICHYCGDSPVFGNNTPEGPVCDACMTDYEADVAKIPYKPDENEYLYPED